MSKIYKWNCKYCGKEYKWWWKFYCSMDCYHKDPNHTKWDFSSRIGKKVKPRSEEWKQHMREAWVRMKEKWIKPPSHAWYKHSDVSKEKMSKSRLGKWRWDKSPAWRGWITPHNKIIRTSSEYKLWRKSIFERDNYTCQKFWIIWWELRAHHINNFSEREDLQLAIDNGITLSKKAHEDFHKIYGIKYNTLEQLNEYLYEN